MALPALLLLLLLLCAMGCVTSSASRRSPATPVVKREKAPEKVASAGSMLTAVEAPQIADSTKFANAPSVEESPQTKSMHAQFARRYGCCGH